MGNGTFTLKYNQADTDYYGMQDESSKLNINKIINDKGGRVDKNRKEEFINLIKKVLPEKDTQAQEIAERFIDWIDNIADNQETFFNGEIQAKNAPLDRLEELTMIDGFSIEDVNKLSGYITIYGDGSININTASQEVLSSLCDTDGNSLGDTAAKAIIEYRNSAENGGIKPIEKLLNPFAQPKESAREKRDILDSRSIVQSSFYKANSQAEVNGVKKRSARLSTLLRIRPQNIFIGMKTNEHITTGLSITDQAVKFVQVEIRRQAKEVCALEGALIPIKSDEETAKALQKLLADKKPKDLGRVILSIPRNLATIHYVKLPSIKPDEIREMSRLQAAKQIPYDPGEIVLGHQVIQSSDEGYSDVVLIIVHQGIIAKYLGLLKKHKVEPQEITIDSQGIACWFSLQNIHHQKPRQSLLTWIPTTPV